MSQERHQHTTPLKGRGKIEKDGKYLCDVEYEISEIRAIGRTKGEGGFDRLHSVATEYKGEVLVSASRQ